MHNILIIGAGKIGALIACLLSDTQEYEVYLIDQQFNGSDAARLLQARPEIHTEVINVEDTAAVSRYIKQHSITVMFSCLPFYLNIAMANIAHANNLHYFDLTEDTTVAQTIKTLAATTDRVFVSQCGIAPGFISIVANSLMQPFDRLDSAKLRVGALPQYTSNSLLYTLTWSTDGLINEYANPCYGIVDGKPATLLPLDGLEALEFDGVCYEAFNTSGGLGNLAETYAGKINTLTYKTLRFPGHCEKIKFLMNELKLSQDRPTLKRILEQAIPKTYQDMVLIYVAVCGYKQQDYLEESYLKKIFPQTIAGIQWSAIQVATAAGSCAVLDIILHDLENYHGMVDQEHISLQQFLNNRFGHYYL